MKNIVKIILVGIITTISRIGGQFLIPAGQQNSLEPSIFAKNGTMPLAFTLYGILAYSLIASLFLFIKNQMSGNRILQGLKYGLSCCLIWIVYLLEPLPHVALLDRITYPIADSVALLVMGFMLGFLFGETKLQSERQIKSLDLKPIIVITVTFLIGRLIQYYGLDIYSNVNNKTLETIAWCLLTGVSIGIVMVWLNQHIVERDRVKRAFILGVLLFGLDLFLFNFFMPLVFDADILDLILRTFIDISAVTLGSFSLSYQD